MLSQIRFQAIVVALVPIAVLAAVLAYTIATRNSTAQTAFWANHTERVIDANDALMNALAEENRVVTTYHRDADVQDTAAFVRAARAVNQRAAVLLRAADATPAEQRQARIYVGKVDAGNRLLSSFMAAERRGDTAMMKELESAPSTKTLAGALTIAKRDVDRSERILAVTALRAASNYLTRFSTIVLVTLLGGVALFLILAGAFGAHVWRRARHLRQNAQALRVGRDPDPLPGGDEFAVAEREYRGLLERLQQEHNNVAVLQQALLPQSLPSVPGVRIDASYTPSTENADVGGDWYDVFALGDGRLGISVGDVAGHGLQASSMMAQIRQSVRMAARLYDQPVDVVRAVNRALYEDAGPLASLFYGELSLNTGLLVYASAGHPLPITVQARGVVEQVPGGGLIMGAQRNVEYRQYSLTLDAGSAMVLFTDGLVESGRRAEFDYDGGVQRLIEVVNRQYYSATENIAQAIQRDVLEGRPQLDDAAVLFIAVTDVGFARGNATKTWTIDARSASAARRAKRAFLWRLGEFAPDGTDLSAPELIFGELVGNVARHTPGMAEITLEIDGDVALLHVCDDGPPIVHAVSRPEDLDEGGRGLLLVESMARDLSIGRLPNGNHVTVELPITLNRREAGPRAPVRPLRQRTLPA
ncbi:MAG TPA: SpoIIE family protein phosphatase [Verrucomicrobiae bacterium]|nr:SpoIIE family protein phosphatase [Verrucomicrobiae bacterium]